MAARLSALAVLVLACSASGCAVLSMPTSWPAVFPGWSESPDDEYDPAIKAEAIVAGFPTVAAAVRPEPPAQEAPESRRAEVRQEIEVVAPPPEGGAEPRPSLLTSAGLLDATMLGPDGEPIGEIADVLVARETGAIAGLIVEGSDGAARFLAPRAVRWSDGSAAPSALEAAPADLRELFAAEDQATVTGVIAEVLPGAPPDGDAELRVRDADNLLHRIKVAAPELVLPRLGNPAPGDAISASAVSTRDAQGKIWIAASLTRADVTVQVRDDAGALALDELASAPGVLHGLEGYSFDVDNALHRISGWELAPNEPRIRRVEVVHDDVSAWMDWDEVAERKPWK